MQTQWNLVSQCLVTRALVKFQTESCIAKSFHRAPFIVIAFLLLEAGLYRHLENTANIEKWPVVSLSSSYIIDIFRRVIELLSANLFSP